MTYAVDGLSYIQVFFIHIFFLLKISPQSLSFCYCLSMSVWKKKIHDKDYFVLVLIYCTKLSKGIRNLYNYTHQRHNIFYLLKISSSESLPLLLPLFVGSVCLSPKEPETCTIIDISDVIFSTFLKSLPQSLSLSIVVSMCLYVCLSPKEPETYTIVSSAMVPG